MQNNTDPMNKTREIPEVDANTSAQGSGAADTGAQDAFSEAMVVEKAKVDIASSPEDTAVTAEFVFPKDSVSKESGSIDAKELQGTAKEYFDATHMESIEDRIGELSKLAENGFELESEEYVAADGNDNAEEPAKSKKKSRKEKRKEKRLRRGHVSDDDMEMLSEGVIGSEDFLNTTEEAGIDDAPYEEAAENEEKPLDADHASEEFVNPLGENETEDDGSETEEDKLIKAFGGVGAHFKSFEAVFGDDEPDEEYTSKEQDETIIKKLRTNAIFAAISVVVTLVASALCIYFEAASGTKTLHPAIFEAGKYGVTYAMSMLQLMFIGVLFNLGGIVRAFRGLRPSKPSSEGVCAVIVLVCTLHSILSAALVSTGPELKSFCSAGCVALLVLSVNSFIKAYTALSSFCIVASKALKISSVDLDRDSGEAAAFEKYLDGETTLFTVGKSEFVGGFFKKLAATPAASKNSAKLSGIVVLSALAVGVVCGILSGIYGGICAFTTVCLCALPVNALISTALPFLFATVRAKKTQTAFIGEAACDAYESTGVVSFDDTEVFPARNVKVSSIRTYGDNRIDKVILCMAKIFENVEGPLSFVFSNSVQSIDGIEPDVQISELFADGISAKVDGREVLVGTASFMKFYDIETPDDNIDESFIKSLGSIMYMSVDGKLASKFYIKYTMNRNFEKMLRSFYDAGICVGIRTLDPCITTELVCGNLKGTNYPVAVIKNAKRNSSEPPVKETVGAMVTLSNVHNFLKGFIKLDGLRNVYRSNTLISVFAAIVGAIIATVLNVTGLSLLGVLFIVVFQLIWCIPTILVSIFSK